MDNFIFYLFSSLLLFSAFKTVTHKNLVFCALYLAVSMMSVAGIFYLLGAHFLAGVQIVVYAGAVIVLFVMVLMLFDLKEEETLNFLDKPFRVAFPFFLLGMISGLIYLATLSTSFIQKDLKLFSTKQMALQLFTKHLLLFEMLGLLLLLVAIGVVILVRLDKES